MESSSFQPLFRFGIVGCGRIAARHRVQIERVGRLVAVCDLIPERAKQLAKDTSGEVQAFTTLSDMLVHHADNIDVLVVCTPNGLHAEHGIAGLRAGCHVLCEKPMALTTDAAEAMLEAAERAGRQLLVVKQNRFNPPVAALKRLIAEGRLGRVLSLHLSCFWNRDAAYYETPWKGTADLDGGILFTQFSHFIDLLWWLAGDVESVQATARNVSGRTDIAFADTVTASLTFASGALGSLHATINSHSHNMEGSLTVFGERGTVKVGGQYLNELEYQRLEGAPVADLPGGNPANEYGTYRGSMSNHDRVYDNLVAALAGREPAATRGEEGIKTVETIERIHRASGHVMPSSETPPDVPDAALPETA